MAIVKADGYGHGVFEVAQTALQNGADCLGVAWVYEAIELRKMGIEVPILVLGNSSDSVIKEIIDFDITPAVSDVLFAKKISDMAKVLGKNVKIHIKIDTGMSRIGFLADSEMNRKDTCRKISEIAQLPNIKIEGMFSHFASADEENTEYTYMQYEKFMKVADALENSGIQIPIKHICNSAGLVKFPWMQLDMVRAGIIIYGLYPSKEFDKNLIDIIPAMSFKARVIAVKELDEGTALSYGMTYKLKKKAKIATVAVGYADGYSRALSNVAEVFVCGKRVKQVGRICMDQCMIDVTAVNNINVGDEVILFGGSDKFSVENTAELIGTIGYELVCAVGRRVPRIYIRDGEVTEIANYLLDT